MTGQAINDTCERVIKPVDPVAVIVNCASGAGKAGCLVTFSAPCSIDPPRYAVWLSHPNHTYRVALRADELIVHMLTRADLPLAEFFGGVSGLHEDKSARVPWTDCGGTPLLSVSGDGCAGASCHASPAGRRRAGTTRDSCSHRPPPRTAAGAAGHFGWTTCIMYTRDNPAAGKTFRAGGDEVGEGRIGGYYPVDT